MDEQRRERWGEEEIIDISAEDLEDVAELPGAQAVPPEGQPLPGDLLPPAPAGAEFKALPKDKLTKFVETVTFNILPMVIAGALGGLLAWAILEPLTQDVADMRPLRQVLIEMSLWGGAAGAAIGLCLGAAEGLTAGSIGRTAASGGLGLLCGFFGGALGGLFGQIVYGSLGGGTQRLSPLAQIAVRTLGWAVVGAFVGMGPGLLTRARARLLNAAIGGVIGGAAGGMLFDPIGFLFGGGEVSRLIALVALGTATGMAISLVEELRKEAWLAISAGPLTGKQFIIYKPVATVGRSPFADVPLVKEPAALEQHCQILQRRGRFFLRDLSGGRTLVNNRPVVGDVPLRSGDIITIGSTSLTFFERAIPVGVQQGPAAL